MVNEVSCNCEKFGRKAKYFESFVVPLWQGVYDSLVERVKLGEGMEVLDVGSGSGEITLRASKGVGSKGRVTAIDIQPEMLAIAASKASQRGLANAKFVQMTMDRMKFPASSFDRVLGNYSLCCCMEYAMALKEIHRVLRPGGRLAYNHGGLGEAEAGLKIGEILEKYKTKSPSNPLQELRDSEQALTKAVEPFKHVETTLGTMAEIGYSRPKVELTRRVIRYAGPEAFVDRMVRFDWSAEMAEISKKEVEEFSREATTELSRLPGGFKFEDDMLYFTAEKS